MDRFIRNNGKHLKFKENSLWKDVNKDQLL